MPYTINPLLMRRSSGTPTLERAAGTVFSGNLTRAVMSCWLSDPLFATPGSHHAFNIQFNDTPATIWWELGVGVDNTGSVGIAVIRQSGAGTETAFDWNSNSITWPACRTHVLISMDFIAGVAQAYINDAPTTFASGSGPAAWFTAGIPFGSGVIIDDTYPNGGYIADLWLGQMASFVDLTVTSNRRKFINADITPVDLGPAGAAPFGTAPTIFQTIPAGGVASDFLTNRGTAGGVFTAVGTTLLDAVGDPCAPPPDETASLALDNVLAFAPAETAGELVFLDWSDNRGRSYGNEVGQPIGRRGKYLTSVQWQRLGYARDRVFRLTWSVPVKTALQGAFIEADTSAKS